MYIEVLAHFNNTTSLFLSSPREQKNTEVRNFTTTTTTTTHTSLLLMAAENKPQASNNTNNKKRKQRYLPHNKPVKKGSYPLHPGVQGFFLTCDGGRERQATHEAINVIDTFYEELVHGDGLNTKCMVAPNKPLNKVIKFSDSDSSSEEEDGKAEPHEVPSEPQEEDGATNGNQTSEKDETSVKKQRLETDASPCENTVSDKTEEKPVQEKDKAEEKPVPKKDKTEEKSVDQLIEDEIKELKDRNKRRFSSLESGCNGCVFVKMHKKDGEPGPVEIVQHMMTSLASTKKHMSRFILRVLPVEVTCYASEEEISKAIKPLISQYFPAEAANPLKFAVLYEARANTGIDRMKIINAVAKSVPEPHKVDLNNPDKTIIVQIAKTLCMIGVVEKYKELSKYNLRQLTSPQAPLP